MRRSALFVGVLLAGSLVCAHAGLADHLPPSLVARGRPEHVLAGVDVYKTTVKSLIERYGKPVSFKKPPETEEAGEVTWNLQGSVLHVSMNADGTAYAAEVHGAPATLTRTGKGLRLGGSLQDVQRIYGSRYLRHGDEVTLQWSDETELRLHFAGQRIESMLLLAEVE